MSRREEAFGPSVLVVAKQSSEFEKDLVDSIRSHWPAISVDVKRLIEYAGEGRIACIWIDLFDYSEPGDYAEYGGEYTESLAPRTEGDSWLRIRPLGPNRESVECVTDLASWDWWLFEGQGTDQTPRRNIHSAVLLGSVLRWLEEAAQDDPNGSTAATTLTFEELQKLEVIITSTLTVIHEHRLNPELAATLQSIVDTLVAQARSPRPDRSVLRRMLTSLATYGAGVLTGVAANYVTDLIKLFSQNWPR